MCKECALEASAKALAGSPSLLVEMARELQEIESSIQRLKLKYDL